MPKEQFKQEPSQQPETIHIWHPVGSHADESLSEILARKTDDIKKYGFSLWAMSSISVERLINWRKLLDENSKVYCVGNTKLPPPSNITVASKLSEDLEQFVDIKIPNVTFHGTCASAFVISDIELVSLYVSRKLSWFKSGTNQWIYGNVPTRGQYLISQPEEADNGLKLNALLHLKSPYIVSVR
jgi:hypothetical protein